MNNESEQENLNAEFRCPLLQRMYGWFATFFLCLFTGGFGALFLWIGIPAALWGKQIPPAWWHVVSGLTVLSVLIMIVFWLSRKVPTRLVLSSNKVSIGTVLFQRSFELNNIRLVTLSNEERTLIRALQLIVQPLVGKPASIWLRPEDAQECFEVLHLLTDAPGIKPDGEIVAPVNPEFDDQAQYYLAKEYYKRMKQSWYLATGLFVLSGFAFYTLLLGTNAMYQPRAWLWVAIGPIAAFGAIIAGRQYRSKARAIESSEDIFNPENEYEEDNDEDYEDEEQYSDWEEGGRI